MTTDFTWNHRVCRYSDGTLGIHEAYYSPDGSIDGVTTNAKPVLGESLDELRETLQRMLRALDTPVIDYEMIGDGEGLDDA